VSIGKFFESFSGKNHGKQIVHGVSFVSCKCPNGRKLDWGSLLFDQYLQYFLARVGFCV